MYILCLQVQHNFGIWKVHKIFTFMGNSWVEMYLNTEVTGDFEVR